jgi:hypothetical protein
MSMSRYEVMIGGTSSVALQVLHVILLSLRQEAVTSRGVGLRAGVGRPRGLRLLSLPVGHKSGR